MTLLGLTIHITQENTVLTTKFSVRSGRIPNRGSVTSPRGTCVPPSSHIDLYTAQEAPPIVSRVVSRVGSRVGNS